VIIRTVMCDNQDCAASNVEYEAVLPNIEAIHKCSVCGKATRVIYKPQAVHFKGKGWFKDGY